MQINSLRVLHRGLCPEKLGTPARFVFPLNHEAYYEALEDSGFRVVRGLNSVKSKGERLFYLLKCVTMPPPMSELSQVGKDLERKTGSMYICGHCKPCRLPLVSLRAAWELRAAIERGAAPHIWTHPFDFVV